jgi:hypothetical protein
MRPFDSQDFNTACALLCEGFPQRSAQFWTAALRRLQQFGGNQDAQHALGFFMVQGDEPVGIALTPASLRQCADGSRQRVVNISSWYVRERFRWRAGFMLRGILADKSNVYTDLTPTPELQTVLPKLGMTRINQGVHLYALPLLALRPAQCSAAARWHVLGRHDTWPAHTPWLGPPRAMVEAHRELGCLPLVLELGGTAQLVIGLRVRVRGLPTLQLVYADNRALVLQHLGALARPLLRQGLLLWMCESAQGGHRATALFRRRELWFARGQDFANRTDVFASELSIIHAPAAQALQANMAAAVLQR